MISLFNPPKIQLDLTTCSNLLHAPVVKDFEQEFAEYVGAKFACGCSSASMAILALFWQKAMRLEIPSILPPVVANALVLGGNSIDFKDDVTWVGHPYLLAPGVWDSAQQVRPNQFKEIAAPTDVMIFSFYPTKPVGSCDGGIVVSDCADKIEEFRTATMNGTTCGKNSWERQLIKPGFKGYLSTPQALIARDSLTKLPERLNKLKKIRDYYNHLLGTANSSDHLFRVSVDQPDLVMQQLLAVGIQTGRHYSALHKTKVFASPKFLPKSDLVAETTLSLPFHYGLELDDVEAVVSELHRATSRNITPYRAKPSPI